MFKKNFGILVVLLLLVTCITGCGGTTVELLSERDSIILFATKERFSLSFFITKNMKY